MSFWLPSRASRVRRGGSWSSVLQYARVAFRNHDGPGYRDYGLGLRLVRRVS